MEKLMEILEEIRPEADFESCKTLIDDGVLDSFDVMSIISELGDEFDIEIKPAVVVPANFNSAEAMWEMVKRLQNK